jgi:hypothetical protein
MLASAQAGATESIDCEGLTYSVQVVCGSEGCFGANLYVGTQLQEGLTWQVQEASKVDIRHRIMSFHAISTSPFAEDISVTANGEEGSLLLGRVSYPVSCDWSAFSK